MVSGIGPTGGNSGSIQDLSVYKTFYGRYQEYVAKKGDKALSFVGWLHYQGYYDNFIQQIENYIETGDESRGDDTKNTLDSSRYVYNNGSAIYQSEDEESMYNFDWESGTYEILTSTEEQAAALGLPDGNNVDAIKLGYNGAEIVDYTFGNLDDGQHRTTYSVFGNFEYTTYVQQEFDIHYIMNALLMDPSDPQYQIAKDVFDDLCSHVNQWLPDTELEELNEIASQYGTNSAEYKEKLKEVLLANLDQAQEWVEEHAHVQNTNNNYLTGGSTTGAEDGSVNGVNGSNGTADSTGGNNNTGSTGSTNVAGMYNKNSILSNLGLLSEYANGGWKSELVSKDDVGGGKRKIWLEKTEEGARAQARAHGNEVILAIENQLVAQLGGNCTAEIKQYIVDAKACVLADEKSWLSVKRQKAGSAKRKGFYGICNTKALVDKFFTEFETLCNNGGKTSQEVEAQKKAEAAEREKNKAGYNSLASYNFQSAAKSAGIASSYQIVNVTMASQIQTEAELKVINPLKDYIRNKFSGKISDDKLNQILSTAAEEALQNPSSWASTTNNYVYTIDTATLISKFESSIKKQIADTVW